MTKMLARALLAIGTLALVSVGVSAPADAAHKHRHVTAHRFGHYLAWRHSHHYHRHYQVTHLARKQPRFAAHRRASLRTTSHHIAGTLPGPCRVAASMGGPCGCWAEHTLLGTTAHVWRGWNLWLADTWRLVFPHVEAAPGTAVVWPHRHVAPVIAVHKDSAGKPIAVTTRESWGIRRVSLAGLVVVQPPTLKRPPIIRWTGAAPL